MAGTTASPTSRRRQAVRIVDPEHFLVATRDSGYRSTAFCIAEFVDNAVQAGACEVSIELREGADPEHPIEILVVDNGVGMDETTLASALSFGGSSRFGDRSSLGRYGMGLPNGALNRARRVDVYTWQGGAVLQARLDLDEILTEHRKTLQPIEVVEPPDFVPANSHGTAVRLTRCDRLDYKRLSTLARNLDRELGRIYRRFLVGGLVLRVNSAVVSPSDPLFLEPSARHHGASQFGDTLEYRLSTPAGSGTVEVRFSELPVERWHGLSSEEKRNLGVTNAPCVSIVRADREIDRGWYFMGAKRRENYDDWWRCEVSFEPSLDELFGITHSKQTISPTPELLEALVPDLEPIGRALNSRIRHQFEFVKVSTPLGEAEKQAARAEHALPALPRRNSSIPKELTGVLKGHLPTGPAPDRPYHLIISDLPTTAAFEVVTRSGQLILLLNARHPLYRDLYGPLAMSESEKDQEVAKHVLLAVLAAARAGLVGSRSTDRGAGRRFRQAWGDVLATFFNA